MKVSVVIPTRNRAALLERAVRSALAQTFRDFEVVVVDDASTDGTEARVREAFAGELAAGRLVYLRNGRHLERSATRNRGVAEARGDYIALLDDDDFFLPFHLEALHGAAAAHPELDFLATEGFTVDAANRIARDPSGIATDLSGGRRDLVFAADVLWGSTSFFKREMFARLGGFRLDLSFSEDTEFFWRAGMSHRFGFIALPTICRMLHPRPPLDGATDERPARGREKAWLLTEESARRLGYRIPARARALANLRIAMFLLHRPAEARAYLRRALAGYPPLLLTPVGLKVTFRLLAGDALYLRLRRLSGRGRR